MARLYGEILSDRGEVHKIGNELIGCILAYGDKDRWEGHIRVTMDANGNVKIKVYGNVTVNPMREW